MSVGKFIRLHIFLCNFLNIHIIIHHELIVLLLCKGQAFPKVPVGLQHILEDFSEGLKALSVEHLAGGGTGKFEIHYSYNECFL